MNRDNMTTPQEHEPTKWDVLAAIDKWKKIMAFVLLVISAGAVVAYVIKPSLSDALVVQPFEVPVALADDMSGAALSEVFVDHLSRFRDQATTLRGRQDLRRYEEDLNIEVPFLEGAISTGTAANLIERLFGTGPDRITGELRVVKGDSIVLTSRYNGVHAVTVSGNRSDMDSLLQKLAEGQLEMFDPFLLASYYDGINDIMSVRVLKQIVRTPPGDDDKWAYNLWGKILMEHEMDQQAMRKFEQAIELDSSFGLPYFNQAVLALKDTDLVEAESLSRKYLRLMGDVAPALRTIGYVRYRQQRFAEALALADSSLVVDPTSAGSYELRSQVFLGQGDTAKAIRSIDRAIDLEPENLDYILKRALIEMLSKDYEEARVYIERGLSKDSANLNLNRFYGMTLNSLNDTAALREYEQRLPGLQLAATVRVLIESVERRELE